MPKCDFNKADMQKCVEKTDEALGLRSATLKYAKFLRISCFTEHRRWLLLNIRNDAKYQSSRWRCSVKKGVLKIS